MASWEAVLLLLLALLLLSLARLEGDATPHPPPPPTAATGEGVRIDALAKPPPPPPPPPWAPHTAPISCQRVTGSARPMGRKRVSLSGLSTAGGAGGALTDAAGAPAAVGAGPAATSGECLRGWGEA